MNMDLESLTAQFMKSGGKIKQCATGDTAILKATRNLWSCQCGCHGDFTEHSMRESGRCSSVIVR